MKVLSLLSVFLLGAAAVAVPQPQESTTELTEEEYVLPSGPSKTYDVGKWMDASKVKSTTPSLTAYGVPQGKRFKCGNRIYSDGEMYRALSRAGQQEVAYKQIGQNLYPHYYGNRENLDLRGCNSKQTKEWPAFVGSTYEGGPDPGADRVIYVYRDSRANGKSVEFCTIITHEGAAQRNGFTSCQLI
ncbi:putative guanyl-specific ribonuclease f1 protein [Neofusicoccum parvum UCRNP2]|uniref:ribonuclease T1 n=1 Tax=Botryosphaeria parva (strain UCR-NP2) TaxID=1287680 RepID=R1EB25_BOTPV|nr:putative guanyl-specific ribonuclease f1 protein [Neofusicoccum parvum UCRNP2]